MKLNDEIYWKLRKKLKSYDFNFEQKGFYNNLKLFRHPTKISTYNCIEDFASARLHLAEQFINKYSKNIIFLSEQLSGIKGLIYTEFNKGYFSDMSYLMAVNETEYDWILSNNHFLTNHNDWLYSTELVEYRVGARSHLSPDFILKHKHKGYVGVEVTMVTKEFHKIPKHVKDNHKYIKGMIKSNEKENSMSFEERVLFRIKQKHDKSFNYEKFDENYLIIQTGMQSDELNILALNIYANYEYNKSYKKRFFNKIIII